MSRLRQGQAKPSHSPLLGSALGAVLNFSSNMLMSDHEGCRIWPYCCNAVQPPSSLFVGLTTALAPPWQDEYSIRGIYTQSH